MLAIGLVLFVAGFLTVKSWGSPFSILDEYNRADYIGGAMALVGMLLMLVGCARWLWIYAP